MKLSSILSLALLASPARSSFLPADELCVAAVSTAYAYITFAGSSSRKGLAPRCTNPLGVTSFYASCDLYCSPEERESGISALRKQCEEGGLELLSREDVAGNLTDDKVRDMRRVEFREIAFGEVLNEPVVLTERHYARVFGTLDTWAYETWTHHAYGYLGYIYWALILLPGTFYRMMQYFFVRNPSLSRQYSMVARHRYIRYISHWIHTNLLIPTTFSHGRNVLWWTFSNRAEGLATLGFWGLSIGVCVVGYRLSGDNIYWPSTTTQLLRYAADRTGILSFANIPLVWLFAGRNNICAWATGWNFATFNVFHRHVAWIATAQAVVHTVFYIVLFFENSNPWRKLQKPYLLWGTLGVVLMVLILPAAVKWLRHRTYETFLLIHIVFSVGVLVGCFYHTIIFGGQEYWVYLWPAVGVWASDRALRVLRVLYCNLHVKFSKIEYTTSEASYDEAADLIRLEVTPGSDSLDPQPGQYYFLYQPFRLTGWESHPFTVGCWRYEVGDTSERARGPKTEEIDTSQIPLLSDDSSGNSQPRLNLGSLQPTSLRLVFWIRPYDGWTRKLRDSCRASKQAAEDNQASKLPMDISINMLIEGPYGHEFPLWNYERVLLLAGGTGIASAVPYIHEHIRRANSFPGSCGEEEQVAQNKAGTRITSMHLVWVTRQAAFIDSLAGQELSTALGRDDFHGEFYVTAGLGASAVPCLPRFRAGNLQIQMGHDDGDLSVSAPAPHPAPDPDPELELDPDAYPAPDADPNTPRGNTNTPIIMHGRPHLDKTISMFAEEAHRSEASTAVIVCGPQKMADEARAAVHRASGQGFAVRYVEESFSW
ncbi:ferric reductase like transmembrane component-domain-containing protein [Aspergillus unguis]